MTNPSDQLLAEQVRQASKLSHGVGRHPQDEEQDHEY